MFKNKSETGNNISGQKIAFLRKEVLPRMSQRALADRMQLEGIDLDKNAIQRIECGKRFVTDIELLSFAKIFGVSCDFLLMPFNNKEENEKSFSFKECEQAKICITYNKERTFNQ